MWKNCHSLDVSGFLLPSEEEPLGGSGEEFEHLVLPAICSKADLDKFNVPKDDPSRLEGDKEADEYPLWAFKHSLAKLRNMRDNLPALTFYGQYQQQPSVDGGMFIKGEWFNNYTPADLAEDPIKYKVMVCDTAMTKETYSDYSVLLIVGVSNSGLYILDMVRGKWEAPELERQVVRTFNKHKPRKVYIEYKASGIGLCQNLKKNYAIPVIRIPRNGGEGGNDKVTRVSTNAPYIAAGYIYLPDTKWTNQFITECEQFPNGAHDDILDTLVDAISLELVPKAGRLLNMSELASMQMNNRGQTNQEIYEELVEQGTDTGSWVDILSTMINPQANGHSLDVWH